MKKSTFAKTRMLYNLHQSKKAKSTVPPDTQSTRIPHGAKRKYGIPSLRKSFSSAALPRGRFPLRGEMTRQSGESEFPRTRREGLE